MKSSEQFAETITKIESLLKIHKTSDGLALCDDEGHLLFFEGQGMFLASSGLVAKSVATYFSNAPSGSTFVCSDPYSGGTSTFDLALIHAVVMDGKKYYLVSTKTHQELNQSFRTVNLPSTVDAEGIRIPPVSYFEKNAFNKELAMALDGLSNDKDFSKKLEAEHHHLVNLSKKIAKALQKQQKNVATWIEQSSLATKQILAEIPDGTYDFVDFVDGDGGKEIKDIKLTVRLVIKDGHLEVDFGSAPKQVAGLMNIPYAITLAASWHLLRKISQGRLPLNHGSVSQISVIAPEASFVNPQYPAAVAGGRVMGFQILTELLAGALSKVFPFQIAAGSDFGGVFAHFGFKPHSYTVLVGGALGASKEKPGTDAHQPFDSIEELEKNFPLVIVESHLRQNSAGKGKKSGGHGWTVGIKVLSDCQLSLLSDRGVNRPYGLYGGIAGSLNEVFVARPGQKPKPIPLKSIVQLSAQDVVTFHSAGGGGWGKSS